MRFFWKHAMALGSLGIALAVACSQTLGADLTGAQHVSVTSVSGSDSPTNGFFVFTTTSRVTGCESGFWLPASDPAYSSMLLTVNAALGRGTNVLVSGDRDQRWPGSADHYCRLVQTP